jgi:hypothetical protein
MKEHPNVGCGLCGSPPNRTGELCRNKRCSRAWKTEEGWRSYLRHCDDRDACLAANSQADTSHRKDQT